MIRSRSKPTLPSPHKRRAHWSFSPFVLALALSACTSATNDGNDDDDDGTEDSSTATDETTGDTTQEGECQIPAGEHPDFVEKLGCTADFQALASVPLDSSIPGARSGKTVFDRSDVTTSENGRIYFQNSDKYPVHYEFALAHLSGGDHPPVGTLSMFNAEEYYSADRRFVLGALTYYEGPKIWAWEIAPYDTADVTMISNAFHAIEDATFLRGQLRFHPTSEAVAKTAKDLDNTVPLVTTPELFEGITYQPLNLGETVSRLRFVSVEQLETEYVGFRDLVVLDNVPNDISVVGGIITDAYQTPLSHINVLSQNRGTPNMALKGAMTDPELLALDGKWVRLNIGANDYTIEEVDDATAAQWWEDNKPAELGVPALDLDTKDLRACKEMIVDEENLKAEVKALIPAFGGKASHYGGLSRVPELPSPEAFGIPVYYYWQFMSENGFHERVAAMLADDAFKNDPKVRDEQLNLLRDDMKAAPINAEFMQLLREKLEKDYPGVRMRFRSSTNAEDLEGFTGAGLYTSESGTLDDPMEPTENAIRKVWSSVWYFRAFEEREYRSIDHVNVGMALLVHRSFPNEEANGVALTANPFDTKGVEPGFYINVQEGSASVVQPDPGVTTDQYIHHWTFPNQPTVFLANSSLVPEGEHVLTSTETIAVGRALSAIHDYFSKAYGPESGNQGWYAMDVEFKFDQPLDETQPVQLWVKQARPHPGWGTEVGYAGRPLTLR
jgi:hypothetical protein